MYQSQVSQKIKTLTELSTVGGLTDPLGMGEFKRNPGNALVVDLAIGAASWSIVILLARVVQTKQEFLDLKHR